jgi:multiple sugar transport system substrate-binding protein
MQDAPLTRRRFLKTAAVAATTLAATPLYACGGSSSPASGGARATSAPGQAAAASGELQKVRALMWSNGPTIDTNFKNRVKKFNEAHKGKVEVDLQLLPYDQYWQKIQLAYSANNPYDTYFWDVQAYGHYKKGLLRELQPYLDGTEILNEDKYPKHLFDVWKLDGAHMYATPENLQTMAFYYNQDLFEKAGVEPPNSSWTWDDVMSAADKLTVRQGNKTTQWGLDLGALRVWWGLQTLSWARGSAFFDKVVEPTKFQMSNAENIQAMQFAQDLVYKHKLAPSPSQGQALAQDIGVFQTGKVAMIPDGSWSISGFQKVPFKWGIAPLPKWQDKRVVPYWLGGWVVAKDSKVPDAAFELARWSATDYQPQMAKEHDWIPILNSARESQEMVSGMPQGFKETMAAIEDAKLGDLYHRNNQQIVAEVFGPTFDQLWNNKLTPEQAAKQIDDKGNALLK